MGQKAAQLTRDGAQGRSMTQPIKTAEGSPAPGHSPHTPKYTHKTPSPTSRSPACRHNTPCQLHRQNKDFEIQLSFCSQKANLDEKAMVLKAACTLGQRRNGGQGLSGTRNLPKHQDPVEQMLWATRGKGGWSGGGGVIKLKSSKRSKD